MAHWHAVLVATQILAGIVLHGSGSGSTKEGINTAIGNGIVKMNVDIDTQYAYLVGIRVRSLKVFTC